MGTTSKPRAYRKVAKIASVQEVPSARPTPERDSLIGSAPRRKGYAGKSIPCGDPTPVEGRLKESGAAGPTLPQPNCSASVPSQITVTQKHFPCYVYPSDFTFLSTLDIERIFSVDNSTEYRNNWVASAADGAMGP